MKTANFLRVVLLMAIFAGSVGVYAQGRGNGHGRGNGNGNGNGHNHNNDNGRDRDRDRRDDNRYSRRDNNSHNHHHHYDYRPAPRRDVHVYHHHAPVERRVVHYYRERPRYVYYRDYNVYYDYHSNMYISFSGNHWVASAAVPVCMHRVDMRRINPVGVDYYEDDFPHYLERRRGGVAYIGVTW